MQLMCIAATTSTAQLSLVMWIVCFVNYCLLLKLLSPLQTLKISIKNTSKTELVEQFGLIQRISRANKIENNKKKKIFPFGVQIADVAWNSKRKKFSSHITCVHESSSRKYSRGPIKMIPWGLWTFPLSQ